MFFVLAGAADMMPLLVLVAFFAIFYFIAIRPQKKQQKLVDDMRNNLQVGDEITTIGGIIGKIVSIKDETCVIETGRDGCKMRILKTAVRCVDVPANATDYTIEVEDNVEELPESTESAPEVKKTRKKKNKDQ
ncbi:MAG: preprotein translocase subunit YajC [Ruminococcaceae bacterium]|nr:preprotein translocase subunit YajC [Oscillospiraceae bacterium]